MSFAISQLQITFHLSIKDFRTWERGLLKHTQWISRSQKHKIMAVKGSQLLYNPVFIQHNANIKLEPKRRTKDILSRYLTLSFPNNSSKLKTAHFFYVDLWFPEMTPHWYRLLSLNNCSSLGPITNHLEQISGDGLGHPQF